MVLGLTACQPHLSPARRRRTNPSRQLLATADRSRLWPTRDRHMGSDHEGARCFRFAANRSAVSSTCPTWPSNCTRTTSSRSNASVLVGQHDAPGDQHAFAHSASRQGSEQGAAVVGVHRAGRGGGDRAAGAGPDDFRHVRGPHTRCRRADRVGRSTALRGTRSADDALSTVRFDGLLARRSRSESTPISRSSRPIFRCDDDGDRNSHMTQHECVNREPGERVPVEPGD